MNIYISVTVFFYIFNISKQENVDLKSRLVIMHQYSTLKSTMLEQFEQI